MVEQWDARIAMGFQRLVQANLDRQQDERGYEPEM